MRNISKTNRETDLKLQEEGHELREIILAIGRQRCIRDPISSAMETMRFTHSQAHVLMWLGFDGPLTMGEVARRGGITGKTLTGLVDRMARAGLLQRERSEEDRRVVHVRLTRKGMTMFIRMRKYMFGQMQELLAILDDKDRQDLFRILVKIHNRVSKLAACAAGGQS